MCARSAENFVPLQTLSSYLKIAIFSRIAPQIKSKLGARSADNFFEYLIDFSWKISNAQRVFFTENGHFLQDRPPPILCVGKIGSRPRGDSLCRYNPENLGGYFLAGNFFPKDKSLGLWSQIRIGARMWGVWVSEKFPGHGIVGPNAGARPGGSGQKISPKYRPPKYRPPKYTPRKDRTPKNFGIVSTQRFAARPGPDFMYTKNLRAPGLELSSTQRSS